MYNQLRQYTTRHLTRRRKRILLVLLSIFLLYKTYKFAWRHRDTVYSFINSFKSKEDFIFDFFNLTENPDRNVYSLDNFTDVFELKTDDSDENKLPLCPEEPPGLIGDLKRQYYKDFTAPTLEKIAKSNPKLTKGGRFAPQNCRARTKLAIIIPLRGRMHQLRVLLDHMHPIWQRQQMDYTVYVMWQAGDHLFNKAKLMNAGFLEVNRDRKYDCYVFHDVDMLLENDKCLYWCPSNDNPRILAAYVDKFYHRYLSYRTRCTPSTFGLQRSIHYFGGASMVTTSQFQAVNGYSNIYWGWGGEDDDLFLRLWSKGYTIQNPYEKNCSYHMMLHKTEESNSENKGHFALTVHAISRMKYEGLNTLRYKRVSFSREPLFTNITIDVGQPIKQFTDFMMTPVDDKNKCYRWMPWYSKHYN